MVIVFHLNFWQFPCYFHWAASPVCTAVVYSVFTLAFNLWSCNLFTKSLIERKTIIAKANKLSDYLLKYLPCQNVKRTSFIFSTSNIAPSYFVTGKLCPKSRAIISWNGRCNFHFFKSVTKTQKISTSFSVQPFYDGLFYWSWINNSGKFD